MNMSECYKIFLRTSVEKIRNDGNIEEYLPVLAAAGASPIFFELAITTVNEGAVSRDQAYLPSLWLR